MNISFHCYLRIPVIGHSWNMSELRSTVVFFAEFCELCRRRIRACSESLCSWSSPILLRLQLFSDTPFQTLRVFSSMILSMSMSLCCTISRSTLCTVSILLTNGHFCKNFTVLLLDWFSKCSVWVCLDGLSGWVRWLMWDKVAVCLLVSLLCTWMYWLVGEPPLLNVLAPESLCSVCRLPINGRNYA